VRLKLIACPYAAEPFHYSSRTEKSEVNVFKKGPALDFIIIYLQIRHPERKRLPCAHFEFLQKTPLIEFYG
jgi:hypothetical protein